MMEAGGHTNEEERLCEICGSVGYAETLLTCAKCQKSREHVYCRRGYVPEMPEIWICEACVPSDNAILTQTCGKQDLLKSDRDETIINPSMSVKLHEDSGQQAYRKKRLVQTGKVKQISTEEVLKLSGRISRKESFSQGKIGLRSVPPTTALSHGKTIGSKTVPPRPFTVFQKLNPGCGMPLKHGGVESASVIKWQAAQTASREMKSPNAYAKEHFIKEQCVKPTDEVRIPKVKAEKAEDGSFKVTSKCDTFKDILPKLKLYLWHLPAQDTTWKGGFKFLDSVRPGKFYGGFKAQPSCRVKRKAYEFSKQMPGTLKMETLPRFHVLADIYQDSSPDLRDIGLYFFPSEEIQGSKENYVRLLRIMHMENSMLRCDFGEVELLIFTSNQLNGDSKDIVERFNSGPLLWGTLHQTKKGKAKGTATKSCGELFEMEQVQQGDATLNHGNIIDMDIDMIGGKTLGKEDVKIMLNRF